MRAPRHRSRPATAALLGCLAALAGGCGGGSTAEPGGPDQPAEPIFLGIYGGFPPNSLRLRIDADGSATAVARDPVSDVKIGPPRRARFELSDERLASLSSKLAEAEIGSLEPGPQVCADCLVYELRYGEMSFESDQLTIPPELEGPIDELSELANEALPTARPAPPPE